MTDDIMKELWEIKDEISRECKGDIKVLVERLRKRQRPQNQLVVNLEKRGLVPTPER